MEITLQVSDKLGQELQRVQDRLPEVLERGLREVLADTAPTLHDERRIIEVLASQPTPEQILALRPSSQFQARVTDLLARGQEGRLTPEEATELERYLLLEHLVRMAKGHAYQRLAQQS